MAAAVLDVVKSQKQGRASGICSVCSANRYVLEAAMLEAKAAGQPVLIESTSNQVNQFGGYMSMTAAQFVAYVHGIAADVKFPVNQVILGGDHLGPNPWQKEPAKTAMPKALELVKSCVRAGYTKLHLDTSMKCADDPAGAHVPLDEKVITERAAEMCEAAEAAFKELPAGSPAPVYIVGTEVPIPGGEQAGHGAVLVTKPTDAERTIQITKDAFKKRGLEQAWERVVATVVQPGVEFGDATVVHYDRPKATALSKLIEKYPNLVFEAHSTDYQNPQALKQLVEDHFAILKVGPWLTFAFREAVFALEQIEREWLGGKSGVELSKLAETMEAVMLANPSNWKAYYTGDEHGLKFARKYSYSDRSRYYWPNAQLDASLQRLLNNLARDPAPATLLAQFMPVQYAAVQLGQLENTPRALARHKVGEVLRVYRMACTPDGRDFVR